MSMITICFSLFVTKIIFESSNYYNHKKQKTIIMKKMIVGLTLVLSLASFTTFARGEEKVNKQVLQNFQKEFRSAENVSWLVESEITTASFNLHGFHVQAYFNEDGDLLGTARNILFDQLPLAVVNAVNNRYGTAPV